MKFLANKMSDANTPNFHLMQMQINEFTHPKLNAPITISIENGEDEECFYACFLPVDRSIRKKRFISRLVKIGVRVKSISRGWATIVKIPLSCALNLPIEGFSVGRFRMSVSLARPEHLPFYALYKY